MNHIPPKSVSPIGHGSGPAIFMDAKDHRALLSTGSSRTAQAHRAKQAKLIAEGKFDEAVQLDIDDIRTKFGPKYDVGIQQMLDYCREIGMCK